MMKIVIGGLDFGIDTLHVLTVLLTLLPDTKFDLDFDGRVYSVFIEENT